MSTKDDSTCDRLRDLKEECRLSKHEAGRYSKLFDGAHAAEFRSSPHLVIWDVALKGQTEAASAGRSTATSMHTSHVSRFLHTERSRKARKLACIRASNILSDHKDVLSLSLKAIFKQAAVFVRSKLIST